MKKVILFGGLLTLGIVLFISTIQSIGLGTIISSISEFKPVAFLMFLAVSFISLFITAYRWKMIIKVGGSDVPIGKVTLHTFAGFMMSYLTPATLLSGEPIRIYLLKKDNHISTSEGTFSVIADKVLEVTGVVIFIAISIILALSKGLLGQENLLTSVITIVITCGLLALFYWLTISGRGFFRTIFRLFGGHKMKKIQHLEEKIWNTEKKISTFFLHHKKVFVISLLLSAAAWFIRVIEFTILLYFLNIHLTFSETFVIAYLPMITMLMPIPGGLGILESGTAALMTILGQDPHVAVTVILLTRIRDIIWVTIGLIHTSNHSIQSIWKSLMNGKKKEPKEKPEVEVKHS